MVTAVRASNKLRSVLESVASRQLMIVRHPSGMVQVDWTILPPTGGTVSWPQLGAVLLECPTKGRTAIVELDKIARSWQHLGGLVEPESWSVTHLSLMSATDGRVLGTSLYTEDGLAEAVLGMLRGKGF
jgi:hypothetical protein